MSGAIHARWARGALIAVAVFSLIVGGVTLLIHQEWMGKDPSTPLGGRAQLLDAYGRLPLAFEPNVGQSGTGADFVSRGSGFALHLSGTKAVLAFSENVPEDAPGGVDIENERTEPARTAAVAMRLVGADPSARGQALVPLAGRSNYFMGSDPSKWRVGIPQYGQVRYEDIYPGVSLLYKGDQRRVEYDFIVAPGAHPQVIRLSFDGVDDVKLDSEGGLVLRTRLGDVRWQKPFTYQEGDRGREPIRSSYVLHEAGFVSFGLGPYDTSKPLIIDPVLAYSTYLGGLGNEIGSGIAIDAVGNAYVTGETTSLDFPMVGAPQPVYAGGIDSFVAKLDPAGTSLIYSTYLGGAAEEIARTIAVDQEGNAYAAGATYSSDYPTTPGSVQPAYGGTQDAYVTKLNPTGDAIVYSTYLGGGAAEGRTSNAVDASGAVFLSGYTMSKNFPLVNPIQAARNNKAEVFFAKLTPAGDALVYSSFLGGSSHDTGRGIAIDAQGSAYVSGWSMSANFPTVNAIQATHGGDMDAILFKVTPEGALVYSTYLGGAATDATYWGQAIAVDSLGQAHIAGYTSSSDFPTANAIQAVKSGGQDAFMAKVSADGGSLLYSTFLGGEALDEGVSLALDAAGNAYATGYTYSNGFPTHTPIQAARGGDRDGFVTALSPDGGSFIYSTYLGGSRADQGRGITVDGAGSAYVTGSTESSNFPLMNPIQPTLGSAKADGFVVKIVQDGVPSPSPSPSSTESPSPSPSPTDSPSPSPSPTESPSPSPSPTEPSSDATPPTVTMKKPSQDELQRGKSFTISWSATDNVAVVRSDLYERVGTSGVQTLIQSSVALKHEKTGALGTTYCYQVQAFDAAGNVGVGPERCTAVPHDDRSGSIAYLGEVTQAADTLSFDGTLTVLDGEGEEAEFSFTGRKFGVLARKDSSSGIVQVWVDGVMKTVDLYSATSKPKSYVHMQVLPSGSHIIRIVWTGTKNISSSGTAVNLDGIGVIS